MSPKHPNVLFLTVDALRPDRMSLLGYDRPTTPTLDKMAENALVCEEAVSPAAFTHICLPAMMTSSRPLSYGGYDAGPLRRPPTVFEAFHAAGYETTAYCTTHWVGRFQGYDQGIDNERMMYGLNTLPGLAMALYRSTLSAWHRGEVSDEEVVHKGNEILGWLFKSIEIYAAERMAMDAADRRDFSHARFVRDGYDFAKVADLASRHRKEFERDPLAYLKRHFYYVPQAHQWIGQEWRSYRHPGKLFSHAFEMLTNKIIGMFDSRLARLRDHRYKRYVDGAELADRIIQSIETWDGEKPFFIWSHFFDTHVPYCAGPRKEWYRKTPDYLSELGYDPGIDVSTAINPRPQTETEWQTWSALYDAAVRFTDEQVGRIVDALERRGIAENTIVAITSDHGEELGEHGDISHHFRLYSHNVRIPAFLWRKGMKGQRIDSLANLIDFVPTLATLSEVPLADGWEGIPLTDPQIRKRDTAVLETLHGGNCLFDKRPIYMSVRTHDLNFMWKEYRDPEDSFSPDGLELYDYRKDPSEQENLYRQDHPALPEMNRLIAERLAEIPEISAERIVNSFGAVGEDAVRQIRSKPISA